MNCSLNRVKTPGRVCANSPHSTEKQTNKKKHIKRSIEAAHTKAADKWGSSAGAGKGKSHPAPLQRWSAEASAREAQTQGAGLQRSAAELLSWKGNLKYYQFKGKPTQRMSLKCDHTPRFYSYTRQQPKSQQFERAEPHGAAQNVCSYDCSDGTIRCFPDIKRHLDFAVWSSQARTDKEGRQH